MKNKSEFNASVSYPFNIADGLAVRYIEDDPEIQRRQLVVVIDEFTDFDVINENRKKLKSLLKELETSQGINLNNPITGNQFGFHQWHLGGMGPRGLRSSLNYLGLALILCSYNWKKGKFNMKVIADEKFRTLGVPFLSNALLPEQLFLGISLAAGMTIQESIEYINSGHTSFAENKIPWEISKGPFKEEKLESRMESFQEKIEQKVITISQTDWQLNRLEFPVYWLNEQGYLKELNGLLDNKGGRSWERSRSRIKKWTDQIVEDWGSSENPQVRSLRELGSRIGDKS